jgi:release factor glutamine methyltransferase
VHLGDDRPLTVGRALAEGIAMLSPASESPRTDARILLARALERTREWIVAHDRDLVAGEGAERFFAMCQSRSQGTPLAYVLGSVWFYGREFAVDARVLVPRPETEHLIDEARAFFAERGKVQRLGNSSMTVLDVGTGSGAIACTIAGEDPDVMVEGTDLSAEAVDVARYNARALGVCDRCRFYCGSFAAPVKGRRFDLVLANLPYVPTAELPQKPNPVGFEPRVALDGGRDGLDAYRGFLPAAAAAGLVGPRGLLLLEAAPPQMAGLVELARAAFPRARVEVGSDFSGRARYARVRMPAQ